MQLLIHWQIPLGPRDCQEFYRGGKCEDEDANYGEIVDTGGPSPRKRPQVLCANSPVASAPLVLNQDTGDVVSGTLEELIHELVPRAHSLPTEKYQFAFLLRYENPCVVVES